METEKLTAYYYRSAAPTEDIRQAQQMQEILGHIRDNEIHSYIIFADDGQTGMTNERSAWKQLWMLLSADILEQIIVTNVNRISRDVFFTTAFLSEASECGVPVSTVDGEILTDSMNLENHVFQFGM